jgi:hypothetical protein
MTPIQSSVSDATIWNVTLVIKYDSTAIIQLIYDVYSTNITNDDLQLAIMLCL